MILSGLAGERAADKLVRVFPAEIPISSIAVYVCLGTQGEYAEEGQEGRVCDKRDAASLVISSGGAAWVVRSTWCIRSLPCNCFHLLALA
jgi:hypothetical protein